MLGAKPAEKTEAATQPAASSSAAPGGFSFGNFGGAQTEKRAAPAELPKPGGFSFGNLGGGEDKTTNTKPRLEPPKPSGSGFNFSGLGSSSTQPAEKSATSTSTEAPTAASGGFSFDKIGEGKTEQPAVPPEAPKTTGLGFSMNGPNTRSADAGSSSLFSAKPAEGQNVATSTSGLFGAPKTSSAAPVAATGSSVVGPSDPAPNLLRGKTLDDVVDGWNKDLDMQVKEFERQAGEVREWDKVLVRNGNQVSRVTILGKCRR